MVPTLQVELHPRVNSRGVCSGCARGGVGYDRLPARRFELVPLWAGKRSLLAMSEPGKGRVLVVDGGGRWLDRLSFQVVNY